MSGTKEALRGVSWKGFAVGFVCVILVSIFYSFSYIELVWTYPLMAREYTGFGDYMPFAFTCGMWMAAVVVIFIALINRIKPVLSREDVTVILIMTMIAGLLDANTEWGHSPVVMFTAAPYIISSPRYFTAEQMNLYKQYLSPVIFGDWEYNTLVADSSMGVNWIKVLPNIVFTIVFMSCVFTAVTFWLLLFRRTFVDEERLSFPISSITMNLVEFTQPSTSRKNPFNTKLFLLGFAIAFLYNFLTGVPYSMNWTGTMYDMSNVMIPAWGWIPGTNIPITPDVSVMPYILPAGLLTSFFLSYRDFYVGWCSLLSIDVLISVIVGFVLFYLVFPIFYMGVWGGKEVSGTAFYGNWEAPFVEGAAINLFAISFGLMLGIIIWAIITNRKSLTIAMKGLFKEPEEEADPYRPLPYRTTWLIFLVTLVASIVLSAVISVDPLVFTVFLVLMLVFMIGHVRYYGEAGANFGEEYEQGDRIQPLYWVNVLVIAIFGVEYFVSPGGEQYYNTVRIMTFFVIGAIFMKVYLSQQSMLGSITMDASKIGRTYNTNLKDMVIKTILPAMVLAITVQTITRTILYHWMPFGKFTVLSWQITHPGETIKWGFDVTKEGSLAPGWGGLSGLIMQGWTVVNMQTYPLDYAWKIAFGLTLAFSVFFLQRRYAWLRLSVAGLLLGLIEGWKFILPAIIALILRYLVVRIYGAEVYDKKVIPLMVGLIVGMHLAWFILMPLRDLFYIYLTEQAKVGPW